MTKAMGGDADLMATLITAQTLLAAITMPAMLVLGAGLFLPDDPPNAAAQAIGLF